MFFDFWNSRKRKKENAEKALEENRRRERENKKRVKKTERNLDKSNAIYKQSTVVLNRSYENEQSFQQKVDEFNKQVADFQKKVDENQKLQQQLQEKQSLLSAWEEDLKNRAETNRKDEMSIHIRSESVKKEEQRVAKKDSDLEQERQNIKEERSLMQKRVEKAELAEKEYNESKEKYEKKQKEADEKKHTFDEKIKDLDSRESKCIEKEKDINKRLVELESKELKFSDEEKAMKDGFEEEKARWEKDRSEIENNLNEKIKEYDRKLADMEAITETLDNLEFDDSEDGKKAKIVVKETIRIGMKTLEDTLQKFKELDEKYASGSFKGFSIPIDEISIVNEELKNQYIAVKEHAETSGLDFSIWLKKIEECILEADKNFKSFFFAECYRHAVEGLSYCKGYGDIINILNEYATGFTSDDESRSNEEEAWCDYYEVLFGEDYDNTEDYTKYDEEVLKKQYRKMSKKYHPDMAEESEKDECEDMMRRLNEIWGVLSDTYKRSDYDSTYLEKRGIKNAE